MRPGLYRRLLPCVVALFAPFAGCADDVTRQAGTVTTGGECHQLLQLQCQCCGSGQPYCVDYVDDLVADGAAYSDSTETECAARRAEAKDVPAWCSATFTTAEARRRACQGFTGDVSTGDVPSDTASSDLGG